MKIKIPQQVHDAAAAHPYPLLFATVSGAHLYGFPSPDSDWDLRGVHLLPLRDVIGLGKAEETVEKSWDDGEVEMDLVTHDAAKFFGMLLKRNGYVLEQLYSPIIVVTSPAHERLKEIGRSCITAHHAYHYLGFAANQWKLFRKAEQPKVKNLLYVYRVLLTGIHLMRSGEVEANLLTLNQSFGLPFIDALVERKHSGGERAVADDDDLLEHEVHYDELVQELELARDNSGLPSEASCREALNALLIELRLSEKS